MPSNMIRFVLCSDVISLNFNSDIKVQLALFFDYILTKFRFEILMMNYAIILSSITSCAFDSFHYTFTPWRELNPGNEFFQNWFMYCICFVKKIIKPITQS